MLTIDWGDLSLSRAERGAIEARVSRVRLGVRSVMLLRRCRYGYEARLRVPTHAQSTEIRLHDEDVGAAVERLTSLLDIVARERRALGH